jgi:hypothetical protein
VGGSSNFGQKVGEMKILVRKTAKPLEENSEWQEAGPWFESLANLPEAIRIHNAGNPPLKRILLTAPNPTLMSLAFAFGASRDAFLGYPNERSSKSHKKYRMLALLKNLPKR